MWITGIFLPRAVRMTAAMFSRMRFSLMRGVIFTRSFCTSSTSTAVRFGSILTFISRSSDITYFMLLAPSADATSRMVLLERAWTKALICQRGTLADQQQARNGF